MGGDLQWKVLREPKDTFFSFTPEQYAEQLVSENALRFRACPREAFRDCGCFGKGRTEAAEHIVAYIAQFNVISCWFTNMIVAQESVEMRAAAMRHMIRTAEV